MRRTMSCEVTAKFQLDLQCALHIHVHMDENKHSLKKKNSGPKSHYMQTKLVTASILPILPIYAYSTE